VAGVDVAGFSELLQVEGKPVYQLRVPGASAIKDWERLRKRVDETGYWPVVTRFDGPWEASDVLSGAAAAAAAAAAWVKGLKRRTGKTYDKRLGVTGMLLAAADDLDVDGWVAEHRLPEMSDLERRAAEQVGTMPPPPRRRKEKAIFRSVRNPGFGDGFLDEVPIVLWPTRRGEEVPALMRYGGWNACPMPHEHVAVMRRWAERYEAEVLAIAGDVVEFRVGRPPKTDAAAVRLLREQYAYCSEVTVSADAGAMRRLAGPLKAARVWSFWWD
jgi:hypothetical protein